MEQVREDVLLVGQRLLDFYDGGPRPTWGKKSEAVIKGKVS